MRSARAWLLAALLTLPGMTAAGTACEQRALSPERFAAAADTALRTVVALDTVDAPVALVSRVGTDLSKYGLVYSHSGFAVRDHPDGRWTVVHLLNDCGSDRSALHAQGLVDFFADDLITQDMRITWLQPEIAQRLSSHLLALPRDALHTPHYNVIARPGSRDYQNSTAWILEQIAAASDGTVHTRAQAYASATARGFKPGRIHISYTKRIMGGLFTANVAFTDHSVATRLGGDYPVVTVRSILEWLQDSGIAAQEREWRLGQLMATPGPG